MGRKVLAAWMLLVAAMGSATELAFAQNYPARPIRFIVSQAPGGPSDAYARLIGQQLSERLGQGVVVENRAGAEGAIGMEFAAKAPPDGYTIALTATSVIAINPNLYKKLPYDPIRDFEPISLIGSIYYAVMVHPAVPANNMKDFIALAKAKPDHFNYGSGGSLARIGTELISLGTGIRLTHVPYKSTSASLTDLLGGQLDLVILPLSDALPYFQTGKLKALAVTSPKRIAQFPNISTVAEAGFPGFEFSAWVSVHAPAGIPKDISRKLNSEISRILSTPDVIEKFRGMGFEPESSTPEQLAALTKADIAKYAKVVKDAGIAQH